MCEINEKHLLPPNVVLLYSIAGEDKFDCSDYFSEIITDLSKKELFFLNCVENFLNNELHKTFMTNMAKDDKDIFDMIINKLVNE